MEQRSEFTKEMRGTHKILLPNMLPYHNQLLQAAFFTCGYDLEIMWPEEGLAAKSLPYLSGDYCFPMMQILGQIIASIQSGQYETDRIAIMEPQTGGACRAGNYYNSVIQALEKMGYEQVPVISLNAFGEEKHEGFSITPKLLLGAVAAVCYGDVLMALYQQTCPYETEQGATYQCWKKWTNLLAEDMSYGKGISRKERKKRYHQIVKDFLQIKISERKRKKVGVTGEIYIKFSPLGNDKLERYLLENGCVCQMGGFVNYAIYLVDGEKRNQALQGKPKAVLKVYDFIIHFLCQNQKDMIETLEENNRYCLGADFETMKKYVEPFISKGCNTGDGWLIAAEIVELIHRGCESILVVHPFGCLVSHVCERGIMKKLREAFPNINIQTIEYDYDSSKTLRESRILLAIGTGEK